MVLWTIIKLESPFLLWHMLVDKVSHIYFQICDLIHNSSLNHNWPTPCGTKTTQNHFHLNASQMAADGRFLLKENVSCLLWPDKIFDLSISHNFQSFGFWSFLVNYWFYCTLTFSMSWQVSHTDQIVCNLSLVEDTLTTRKKRVTCRSCDKIWTFLEMLSCCIKQPICGLNLPMWSILEKLDGILFDWVFCIE